MESVFELQNDHLSVSVRDDASFHILDKVSGAAWETMPCCFQEKGELLEEVVWNRRERVWADVYTSHFACQKTDRGLRVTVVGPARIPKGQFTLRLRLDGPWLETRIEEIEDRLPSLVFPTPIRNASLIIPNGVGQWLKEAPHGMESFIAMQNNGLNMRWIGGLKEDADRGWMMIFEDYFADSGVYRNGLAVSPVWVRSMGSWGPTRSVRYRFTEGGYVPMAKIFRSYAYDNKIVRSLREKIEECPALGTMLGGRTISMFQCCTHHHDNYHEFFGQPPEELAARDGQIDVRITHADASKIVDLAKQWGMKKGVFNLRGTFKGGYDEHHPDIWPPEKALGTVEELKELFDQPDQYMTVLHDNYQDIYPRVPSFPQGVIQKSNGELLHGGYWHGGQCFIICSKRQIDYARRNWERLKQLGMRAHFIDTAACVQFYQCFHPDHPVTRSEEIGNKQRLMAFFKEQGMVLGSEEAADYGMYHIDFLENRHEHVPGASIPLWPLVFHDAAFYARYSTEGTSGGDPVSQLENFLWGYMCYYPANSLEDFRRREKHFRETLAVDEFHARVGLDELIVHRYLTEDFLVEQTEFSSGVSVIANFANEARSAEGKTIAPRSHIVIE